MMYKRYKIGMIILVLCSMLSGCTKEKERVKQVTNISLPNLQTEIKKIACIGDSITYGSELKDRLKDSYPAQLQQKLKENAVVKNFGVDGACVQKSGNKSYWTQNEYTKSLSFAPNVVVLMLGTNDSKTVNWKGKEAFRKDYEALISQYEQLESNPTIYVMTPSFAYPKADGTLMNGMSVNEIETITTIVKQLSEERKITCIDIHTLTKHHGENYQFDGVHPDTQGAERIAQAVYEQVQKDSLTTMMNDIQTWMSNYLSQIWR